MEEQKKAAVTEDEVMKVNYENQIQKMGKTRIRSK